MTGITWAIRFFVLTMTLGLLPGHIALPSMLTTTVPVFAADKSDLLDLNTATAEQLKALPGIGEAYSEKIIKGRPYQRKDELVQKKILPRTTHEQINYKIVVEQK